MSTIIEDVADIADLALSVWPPVPPEWPHRSALAAMVLAMSDVHSGTVKEAEAIAKAIIEAIARGEIPNVSICS